MKKLAMATLCVLSTAAFAQSAANVSTASSGKSTFEKIKEDFDLGYAAEFYGPSIKRPGSRPSDGGNLSQSDLRYDSQISVDYHLFDDKELTLKLRFRNEFGDKHIDSETGEVKAHDNGQMRDTRIGIQGVWYTAGNFSYWARYHVELPTSTNSKRTNRLGAMGAAQDFAFRLNDKTIIGLEQSTYFYKNDNDKDATGNAYLYNAPYVNFALSDNMTFKSRLEYEVLSDDKDDLQKDSSRLLSGVDFQLNSNWSVYPHIMLGTDGLTTTDRNVFDEDSIGVAAWISGAIF